MLAWCTAGGVQPRDSPKPGNSGLRSFNGVERDKAEEYSISEASAAAARHPSALRAGVAALHRTNVAE